ncbi:hypothetical protein D9M72_482900 [compost metagenome]
MARCVASRSIAIGRASAWNFGAVLPAAPSFSVSQAMQSEFSACTITSPPSWRATDSTSRISRSFSLRSS